MVKIAFYINGKATECSVEPQLTALKLIREQLQQTGTREGCNEGDCGACTVLWGRKIGGQMRYRAVNSCLLPAVRLHNSHLITIEGLKSADALHPIQQAFLDHNGAQCGFCTPGFIISIFSLLLDCPQFTIEQLNSYLEGNLCRCTGYESIVKAVSSLKGITRSELLPVYFTEIEEKLSADCAVSDSENYFRPANLSDALSLLADNSDAVLLAGNTDLQPSANYYRRESVKIIDLLDLTELNKIGIENNQLIIGAGASLTDIVQNSLVIKVLPELVKVISQMASNQIRNTATIGGNIANASPVADTVPLLLALEAKIVLACKECSRTVELSDYYLSYKKTLRKKNEIITAIVIPLSENRLSFVKAAKRKSVDISTLSSACSLHLEDNKIARIKIAVGGGGPVPLLLYKTAEYLTGKEIAESIVKQAALIAVSEITPIGDIRGSAEFRKTLLKNQLLIHLGLGHS